MTDTTIATAPAAPAPGTNPAAPKPHPTASLYVGDLNNDVTEGVLFELFNQVGPVASIRVCRDTLTRRSLGYAYVNFHSVVDAERALDTLNNTGIKGRPCRIMWSQRDPSIRKSGVGNIFIKNLDPAIGHKELHDTFSAFGNILSCKVATDEKGGSRGYGFVHFETAEAAESAIQMVNDMMIGTKKVFVGHFRPRKEREQEKETSWTNVYIKNLDSEVSDDKLTEIFSAHGPVSSAVTMRGQDGRPKGFAFVNFDRHEDAVKAVDALHGSTIGSQKLWCGRAQKKAEREAELRKKYEQMKMDRLTKYQGINLYIKNLEDEVNEERLRKEFAAFGDIKSVKIMQDEKAISRGFGFVCFSTPEEANRAITEMNGRVLQGCTKPLYVALHEPREVRRHRLAARVAQGRGKGPRGAVPQTGVPGPIYGYYPGATPQGFVYPQQLIRGGRPTWGPQQAYPNYMAMPMPQASQAPRAAGAVAGTAAPAAPAARGGRAPAGGRGGRAGQSQARPQAPELLLSQLVQYPADQQKMLLGERLYRLIERTQPQLAGKITGMFLDSGWSVEELFELTQQEDKLNAKTQEAVKVLEDAGQVHAEQ